MCSKTQPRYGTKKIEYSPKNLRSNDLLKALIMKRMSYPIMSVSGEMPQTLTQTTQVEIHSPRIPDLRGFPVLPDRYHIVGYAVLPR